MDIGGVNEAKKVDGTLPGCFGIGYSAGIDWQWSPANYPQTFHGPAEVAPGRCIQESEVSLDYGRYRSQFGVERLETTDNP
jgi:hypothetical protein